MIGWIAAVICFVIGVTFFFVISFTILSFFIAISLYFYVSFEHFSILVGKIDQLPIEIEGLDNPPAGTQFEKTIYVKAMLRETIQFHTFAKK